MAPIIKLLLLVAVAYIILKFAIFALIVILVVWALRGFRGHPWKG